LTIIGFGTIISTVGGSGLDPTAFEWELSAETPTSGGNVQFTFSATSGQSSNGNPVPDGGVTVAFLGLALAGLEGLRRKLGKA
jgi:VPDSG-CTERM motif